MTSKREDGGQINQKLAIQRIEQTVCRASVDDVSHPYWQHYWERKRNKKNAFRICSL